MTSAVGGKRAHSHSPFNRPRIGPAVSETWQSAKIKQFEHVLVGPSIALLRVTGKVPRRKLTVEKRPRLLADDGHVVARFAALPSPPDEKGVLRAAYSVPADVVKPETVFSLELADGGVISLPAPTRGPARVAAGEDAPAPLIDTPSKGPSSEPSMTSDTQTGRPKSVSEAVPPGEPNPGDRRAALVDKLTELSVALAESERVAAEHQSGRIGAEARAAEARAQNEALAERMAQLEAETRAAEAATEQSMARLNELEIWRGELERRLTATTSELGAAQTRLREDEDELQALRAQLADAGGRADGELHTLREQLSDTESRADRELEALREELTDTESRADRELEALREELTDAEARVELARSELETRAAPAPGVATPDAEVDARIRQLESDRGDLARRAQRLALLLEPASRLAELAGTLADARAEAESLQAVAAEAGWRDGGESEPETAPDTSEPPAADAGPDADTVPGTDADTIEAISRRAEAEAEQRAERELAQAAEQARSRL